ncbi:MAG: GTPase HflX [Candidatus Omnitrophica bacterium]|nr:GTPase HflX [Candidatus Omnitrophota bacterium]
MEHVLLVTVQLDARFAHDGPDWAPEDESQELQELATSAGCRVIGQVVVKRHQPVAGTFLGSGKLEELRELSKKDGAQVLVFNQELSATQQRNIEEEVGVKTIDRTQLILDIFAQRAKSQEGKVQVELAQLRYLLPRLTGKGVLLSRLGGGIGTRGPGEQKLEVDRRRIRMRIARLSNELSRLGKRRQAMRVRRKESGIPIVALVGYTNAGKTTLLNRLTGADSVTRHQLFTTLDPLARRLQFDRKDAIILTDTVGFLHHLPHHLIEAFKATLEETRDASIILHVLDVSHPRALQHAEAVERVLHNLEFGDKLTLTALNKSDLVSDTYVLTALKRLYSPSVAISARTGEGIEELLKLIQETLHSELANPPDLLS